MADDFQRHGESETFAAARLRKDHGVDAEQFAVEVDQRATRIAGIHGCVGLYEDPGIVGSELAVDRADQAQRSGLRQSHGASVGQHQLALVRRGVAGQVEERHSLNVDFQQREIVVGVGADDCGGVLAGAAPLAPSGAGTMTRMRVALATTWALVSR